MGTATPGSMNVSGVDSPLSTDAPPTRTKLPLRIALVLLYVWFFIALPHDRFDFLITIRFERLLAIGSLIVLAFSGYLQPRLTRISAVLLAFYLLMWASYAFCPYKGYSNVELWFTEYWKTALLFFIVGWNVSSSKDLKLIIFGVFVVIFVNQLHSWVDFALGGNYVYQQGIKRIKSVWNGDGIGAPNQFALVALLVTPAIIFLIREAKNRRSRLFFVSALGLALLSILFSGTRGALLGFIVVSLVNIIRERKIVRFGLVVGLAITIAFPFLPPDLKHRYLSIFGLEALSGVELHKGADDIQKKSQDARREGLVDGYRLANRSPVFGYGPGSSAFARRLVTDNPKYKMYPLQTHNLYGQVLGEFGWSGAFFLALIVLVVLRLNRQTKDDAIRAFFTDMAVVLLFYGLVSHTLYRWYMVFFLGLFDGYVASTTVTGPGEKEGTDDDKRSGDLDPPNTSPL